MSAAEATPLRSVGDRRQVSSLLAGRTVSEAIDIFAAFGLPSYNPTSKRKFLCRLHPIREFLGGLHVEELGPDASDKLMLQVMSLRCSRSWMASIRAGWFAFVRFLLARQVIAMDLRLLWPSISIKEADLVRNHSDFSREEIAQLCTHLSDPMVRYVYASCFTGQRLSNICGWDWSQVTEERFWVIPAISFKQRRILKLPICEQLWTMIQPRGGPKDAVITGIPHRDNLRDTLKIAAMRAGIDPRRARPHNFRRTCCRWLKEGGASREEVQELMGWASDAILLRHYWDTKDAERWATVKKL